MSLVVASGGTILLAEIGRDFGKKKELRLFKSWGGRPSLRLLRHRDAPNKVLLERQHRRLQELVPDVKIPTVEEELADPSRADDVYESLEAFLRENTRDKARFPLLFEELCNYGFRRNLWGMKPIGLIASIGGTVAIGASLILSQVQGRSLSPLVVTCGFLNLAFLFGWLFWFTPSWVKIPADAYAARLLGASENI